MSDEQIEEIIVDSEQEDGAESNTPANSGAMVRLLDEPPTLLPALVQGQLVPFPGPIVPIILESGERQEIIQAAKATAGFFVMLNRRTDSDLSEEETELGTLNKGAGDLAVGRELSEYDTDQAVEFVRQIEIEIESDGQIFDASQLIEDATLSDDPLSSRADYLGDIHQVGVVCRLLKVLKLPDNRISALIHLLRRASPVELVTKGVTPTVRVVYPTEIVQDQEAFEATFRQVRLTLESFFEEHPNVPEELKITALSLENPGILADFVAQHLSRDYDERLKFLNELDLSKRMRLALEVAIRELDMLTVGNRISQEIREKVENHQREYLLREQLRAIRVELGEEKDPTTLAVEQLGQQLDEAGLPEEARARADDEMKRLQLLPSDSPEHNVVRTYLEWIASLPWDKMSPEDVDIERASAILEEDHYGLVEVKERILEYLSVRKLNPENRGSLLCFAGPPGVGKTSLGQSIARALNREFYRFSVGGMRDEAEIKGHRRTYIGAMPGRILQALRHVKTKNPVIMLDELDKMGSDWRGDPSSAMLEVLDPSQNTTFMDHYLDLTFDLSNVMFIATANVKSQIPGPLLDRLEVIDLPGYIPEEKIEIARRYLFDRQRTLNGLKKKQMNVSVTTMRRIIDEYTAEAGVRELNRMVGKLCRKRATEVVAKRTFKPSVSRDDLEKYLGPPRMHDDRLRKSRIPGVAMGLAWTSVGGAVLFIEAAKMRGKGQLKVTGKLGEVMTESTAIALSHVKRNSESYNFDYDALQKYDIHLHFPAGAVPKDGPSAGITITTALISLLSNTPIAPRLAMTGEITLGGEVLPVGGIREKVVAARAMGVKTVVLPAANRADVEEIPAMVREKLDFVFAQTYDDVFKVAFPKGLVSTLQAPKGNRPKSETGRPQKRPQPGGRNPNRRGNPKRRFGSKDPS